MPKFSPGKRLKDRIAEAHKPKEAPKAKKAKVSPAKAGDEEKPKKPNKK